MLKVNNLFYSKAENKLVHTLRFQEINDKYIEMVNTKITSNLYRDNLG